MNRSYCENSSLPMTTSTTTTDDGLNERSMYEFDSNRHINSIDVDEYEQSINSNNNRNEKIWNEFYLNKMTIDNEIQRFESVHPFIYSLNDKIDSIQSNQLNGNVLKSLRELIVRIEDTFVNSPEWTLPNNTIQVRLAILGDGESGRSDFVYRYMTGRNPKELRSPTPEGGRYKSNIHLDNDDCLLLLREEDGALTQQLIEWCNSIIILQRSDLSETKLVASNYVRMIESYSQQTNNNNKNGNDILIYIVNLMYDENRLNRNENEELMKIRKSNLLRNCFECEIFIDSKSIRHLVQTIVYDTIDRNKKTSSYYPEEQIMGKNSNNSLALNECEVIRSGFLFKKENHSLSQWKRKFVQITKSGYLLYVAANEKSLHGMSGNVKKIELNRTMLKVKDSSTDKSNFTSSVPMMNRNDNSEMKSSRRFTLLHVNNDGTNSSKDSKHLHRNQLFTTNSRINLGRTSKLYPSSIGSSKLATMTNCGKGLDNGNNDGNNPFISDQRHRRQKSSGTNSIGGANEEFYLTSSEKRVWTWATESITERNKWVEAIQSAKVESLVSGDVKDSPLTSKLTLENKQNSLNNPHSSPVSNSINNHFVDLRLLQLDMKLLPGNDRCADCGANEPKWASINIGCLICIGCSGAHRALGVHHSRIKSIELDEWTIQMVALFFSFGGNDEVNRLYLYKTQLKNSNKYSDVQRQMFIREKYVNKKWMNLISSNQKIPQIIDDIISLIDKKDPALNSYLVCLRYKCSNVNTNQQTIPPREKLENNLPIVHAIQHNNLIALMLIIFYSSIDQLLATLLGTRENVKKLDILERIRKNLTINNSEHLAIALFPYSSQSISNIRCIRNEYHKFSLYDGYRSILEGEIK
ncbi:hypothetical protein SNEBB_009381 [Seison nebaliae]|nr:hypothetical protein SNEBB_009381 [Seison nebaliae]